MVGYDPKGTCVYIGDGANKRLASLLLETDKEENDEQKKYLLRRKNQTFSGRVALENDFFSG
jgi:hypothetical protein